MTSLTHMLQIALDWRRLTQWALDRRMDPRDLGYVSHALLCDAFGDMRPQPFSAEEKMGRVKILGYGTADGRMLDRRMAETAEPEVAACVLGVESKPMPAAWESGRRYAFRLRVAPTRQGRDASGRRREADALLFAEGSGDRAQVYRAWLDERLGRAASLESCELRGFRLMRACRRARDPETGKRPATVVTLPDATYEGVLRIGDPDAFAGVLRNGIGRHKAFGFGALLLRPVRAA